MMINEKVDTILIEKEEMEGNKLNLMCFSRIFENSWYIAVTSEQLFKILLEAQQQIYSFR